MKYNLQFLHQQVSYQLILNFDTQIRALNQNQAFLYAFYILKKSSKRNSFIIIKQMNKSFALVLLFICSSLSTIQLIDPQNQTFSDDIAEYSILTVDQKLQLKDIQLNKTNIRKEQSNKVIKLKQQFKKFFIKYNIKYNSKQEEQFRFGIFIKNVMIIQKHNLGPSLYKMGINKFADLTDQQFQSFYLMNLNLNETQQEVVRLPNKIRRKTTQDTQQVQWSITISYIQEYALDVQPIDWRQKINFNAVKDQGKCAACYAFSIIAAIEHNWAIRQESDPPVLSEQQIVDCCGQNGFKCNGCSNGSLSSTFKYLYQYGIAEDLVYPYQAKAQQCKQQFEVGHYLNQNPNYQFRGVESTRYFLVNYGPLAVAADSTTWKFYKKGKFDGCPLENFKFKHSVLIVGIQQDGTWIIRNSWGSDWGEEGYIRIISGNGCGITNFVYLPEL